MNWKIENIPELTGYTLEWAEPNNYFLSQRNIIFHSETLKTPFKQIAIINAPTWKQFLTKLRPIQRLFRFSVTNIIPNSAEELFITFDKSVGVVRNGKYQTLSGLKRPCRVLRSACAVDQNKDIYFGEYLANDERGEMFIYKYISGSDLLEVVYTFPANSIKHIHGLYFDEYTNSIFCLTGDEEKECQILQSFDGCNSFEVIGKGDETWRAVSILFDENNLYYGTDAEFRSNHIYKVNRKTLERTQLGEVNGTVFYSKKIGNNLFFTTTAENAPSQKENVAALWHIGEDEKCTRLISFEKDWWHPTLFQFGTIHFPNKNSLIDQIYFYLVGVNEDNQVFKASLK